MEVCNSRIHFSTGSASGFSKPKASRLVFCGIGIGRTLELCFNRTVLEGLCPRFISKRIGSFLWRCFRGADWLWRWTVTCGEFFFIGGGRAFFPVWNGTFWGGLFFHGSLCGEKSREKDPDSVCSIFIIIVRGGVMFIAWKIKRKKRFFSGSYTIEASFLLPILLFLLIYVLYLAFFLYDQCIILQGSYQTALSTERMVGEEEEKIEAGEEKYGRIVTRRLIHLPEMEKELRIQEGDVWVTSRGIFQVPAAFLFDGSWKFAQNQKAVNMEPVHFIRVCNRVKKAADVLQKENGE